MTSKISPQLLKELKAADRYDPKRAIPVIVTLTDKTDLKALEKEGLKITHVFENISAVSGTLTTSGIKGLAQSEKVESIEYDGEVHALGVSGES